MGLQSVLSVETISFSQSGEERKSIAPSSVGISTRMLYGERIESCMAEKQCVKTAGRYFMPLMKAKASSAFAVGTAI